MLGESVEHLNVDDQYQCHAFVNLSFVCDGCELHFLGDDTPAEYGSWDWCKAIALRARESGWQIQPPTPDGTHDLTAYCQDCARRLRNRKFEKGPSSGIAST
jgi:hypothetical protein